MNKISICVPCYNVEPYIDRLFDCLANQTFKDFEVVIVDDGSSDNTFNEIKKNVNLNKFPNSVKLLQQKNKGLAESRNILLKNANSEYIFFLDADDTIPNNALEMLYKNSNNATTDIVVGRAKVIFNQGVSFPFLVQYRYTRNITNTHYIKSNLCTCWGALIKKSLFDNEQFLSGYSYEDIGLINYIYLKSKSFKAIKQVTYHYWRRKESLSTFSFNNRWKIIDIYEQTKNTFKKYDDSGFLNKQNLRAINGTLFQILTAQYWLSTYYSNNKYINKLPLYAIVSLLRKYSMKLKISKSFWKLPAFFYLQKKYWKVKNFLKNENYLNSKLKIIDVKEIKNNKNYICLINKEYDTEFFNKYDNVTFLSTKQDIDLTNVLYGIKPRKIDDSLLVNKPIYFIDLSSFDSFNDEELKIVKNINKRIIILINKNIPIDGTNFLRIN